MKYALRLLAGLLTAIGMGLLPISAANAQRSLAEGAGTMELQSANKSHSYTHVRFADGTIGERFMLKAGDCPRSTGDCRADRERVEFFARSRSAYPGDTRWYAWSFYLPSNGFPVPRINGVGYSLGQVHQRGTSGSEVLYQLFPDGLFLNLSNPFRLDDDPMNPIGP